MNFGFLWTSETFWLSQQLLVSEETLKSMELVLLLSRPLPFSLFLSLFVPLFQNTVNLPPTLFYARGETGPREYVIVFMQFIQPSGRPDTNNSPPVRPYLFNVSKISLSALHKMFAICVYLCHFLCSSILFPFQCWEVCPFLMLPSHVSTSLLMCVNLLSNVPILYFHKTDEEYTVSPVLNRVSRAQNIFLLKPDFRLIKVYYDSYGTWTYFRLRQNSV
jgi:hypothetical protein